MVAKLGYDYEHYMLVQYLSRNPSSSAFERKNLHNLEAVQYLAVSSEGFG